MRWLSIGGAEALQFSTLQVPAIRYVPRTVPGRGKIVGFSIRVNCKDGTLFITLHLVVVREEYLRSRSVPARRTMFKLQCSGYQRRRFKVPDNNRPATLPHPWNSQVMLDPSVFGR